MQNVVVRQLSPDDAPTAQEIVRRFKGAEVPLDHLHSLLANPINYLFVGYIGEEIAGFIYAHRLHRLGVAADHLFIYEIEVNEGQRRKGVGQALIERVRQIDPSAECFVLTEGSNDPAMRFYEATGGTVEQGEAVLVVYGPRGRNVGDTP